MRLLKNKKRTNVTVTKAAIRPTTGHCAHIRHCGFVQT